MSDFVDYEPNAHSVRSEASIEIRPAVPADVEGLTAVLAVRGGAVEEHVGRAARLIEQLEVMLVADKEGVLVGWGGIRRYSIQPDAETEWLVAGLTVVPEMRRRGIAARVLRGVLDATARSAPNEPIFSVINARNRASLDLHQQLGFTEVSRATTFAGIPTCPGELRPVAQSKSPT